MAKMFWKNKNNFYKDFFENKEARNKPLKEERKELLAVIAYLTDGVLIFDKKNRLSLINPQAEKLLEARGGDVLGKTFLELNCFPNIQPLVSFLGGGIKETSKKEIKIKKNFVLEVSAVSMVVKKEKISSLIILHDISRQKLIEKAKSDFVTLAAHQLRTPASIIKWTAKMLLDGDSGKLGKEQKERIRNIYKTNNKMIKLVNDLLNIAQIEEGKYLSKLALFSFEEVIASVAESSRELIKKKKIKVEIVKPKKNLPKVMLDFEKMTIAVKGIFDNALKYSFPGGKIIISLKEKNREIETRIKDKGLGIPKSQRKNVFSKFFRGANIIKVDTEGTGLSLYIAKNIIEAHGGKIWFESEENKETTFYFTIPIKKKFGEFLSEKFY